MQVQSLSQEDLLEEEMATHFGILAWKIPWTEKPGGLQSRGSKTIRHDQSDLVHTHTHTHTHIQTHTQLVGSWFLVPQPGIEPVSSAVKAKSPNQWTVGKSLEMTSERSTNRECNIHTPALLH